MVRGDATIGPAPAAMRVRAAIVPLLYAAMPWWWFGADASSRGERGLHRDVDVVAIAASVGCALTGWLHVAWLRRWPGRHALLLSMVLAAASPFVAAAAVGVAAVLPFLDADTLWLGLSMVQIPWFLCCEHPVRFAGAVMALGVVAWWLVRPPAAARPVPTVVGS